MKRGIFLAVLPMLAWVAISVVQVLIGGDMRKDGAYVDNHYRISPDGNAYNNWTYAESTNLSLDSQGTSDPIHYLDRNSSQGSPNLLEGTIAFTTTPIPSTRTDRK